MIALAAALVLAAVTAAQLEALQAADQRVMDIGYRLSTRGVALCPGMTAPQYGLRFHVRGQYPKRDWPALKEVLYLDRQPGVLAVAAEGPAAKAGIAAGDVLYSIDATEFVGVGDEGYPAVARVEAALAAPAVKMYLLTRGRVIVAGVPGCASTVELIPSDRLIAKADGRIVQLTTGVIEQTRDDDELAFVIAHEMAHNILRHRARLDREGRDKALIRATEREADILALKLMKAAGYEPAAAARFWTRFGAKTGAGIFSDGTHMRTKARVAFLASEALKLAQ